MMRSPTSRIAHAHDGTPRLKHLAARTDLFVSWCSPWCLGVGIFGAARKIHHQDTKASAFEANVALKTLPAGKYSQDSIPTNDDLCLAVPIVSAWRAVVHLFSDAEAMRIERGEGTLSQPL
jgi:hypothetical protein